MKFEHLGILVAFFGGSAITGGSMAYFQPGDPPAIVAATMATVRDVSWFKSHMDEMNSKFRACMNNPGMGELDPECQNVFAAKQSSDIDVMLSLMPNGRKQ